MPPNPRKDPTVHLVAGSDGYTRVLVDQPDRADELARNLNAVLVALPVVADYRDTPPPAPTLSDAQQHAQQAHPGWEYTTTTAPAKGPHRTGPDIPMPEGDGWEINTDAGRGGQGKAGPTLVTYWRRRTQAETP